MLAGTVKLPSMLRSDAYGKPSEGSGGERGAGNVGSVKGGGEFEIWRGNCSENICQSPSGSWAAGGAGTAAWMTVVEDDRLLEGEAFDLVFCTLDGASTGVGSGDADVEEARRSRSSSRFFSFFPR